MAAARATIARSGTRPISCSAYLPSGGGVGGGGGTSGSDFDDVSGAKNGGNYSGNNCDTLGRAPDEAIGQSADNGGSKGPHRPMDDSTD